MLTARNNGCGVRVAGPPGQRLILFVHDPSRSAQVAARLLDGACGYIQSDGYAAYDAVAAASQLTHVGCFAHAWRRFLEAVQALPASERKKNTAAHEFVRRIDACTRLNARSNIYQTTSGVMPGRHVRYRCSIHYIHSHSRCKHRH
jgi:hypothetical protein